ncbi:MAG: EAL domain-containing protein [Pseudomonadota bacterium]
MSQPRRTTLRTKLIAGFGVVALLVIALQVLSNHIIRDAAARLEIALTEQVHPLARLNKLQARISRVRVLEIELPRLADYFAVTTQLELLKSEKQLLAEELKAFIEAQSAHRPVELRSLEENWRRYEADLEQVVDKAGAMNMKAVEELSAFESSVHFRVVSRILGQMAESMESRANDAFQQTLERQDRQRRIFLLTSVVGLLAVASWVVLFARSVSRRVSSLRDAAMRAADGVRNGPMPVAGNDELADLGAAFNAMREKVAAREAALQVAHEELEYRVKARTGELNDANALLTREVEERRRAEQQLRLLSQAVEQSPVSVMMTDVDGRILYVNQAFVKSTGYRAEEALGRTPRFLGSGCTPAEDYRRMWDTILAGKEWEGELLNRRRDGSVFWESVRISPVTDAQGAITHFVAVHQDISVRKEQERKILYQVQYDSLTGLPNRLLAMDRLSQTIQATARDAAKAVLMFIDLDDFKKVNDTLGHDTGDLLLVQAARRLRESVRGEDTVARQGGDEFLVIMGGLRRTADAEIVADKIIRAFAPPFHIGENEVVVTPSIGLAVYPDDGNTPATLLRNADLAMYEAKEAGRNGYRFFNQAIHDQSVQRLELERRLRNALARGEFMLLYQPMVAASGGALVAVEALLRWNAPDYGMMLPEQFLAVAEQTGLIVDIGDWVLRTACAQARQWHEEGATRLRVAVNVSPRQFRGGGLVDKVRRCLEENHFPPGCLQIEVTEGLLMRNHAEVGAALRALDAMGVGLAMDDFGTGYSSLSHLKSCPFHILKIDRGFVRDLAADADDRALVTAAIRMGKGLGLSIVAEGVETREQLAFLVEQGCDVIQGYLFGEPQPADQFAQRWLARMASCRS